MTDTSVLILPAPAKLNRMLHVVGRRADGYHDLQTLFQFLDHGDTLSFRPRRDGRVTLSPEIPGVANEHNLIIRAARLLQQSPSNATDAWPRSQRGADIQLDKQLPMGGGLGGGSSDAATTLLALNHLWQLALPIDTLAALGVTLGADVPVFVRGFAAWGEGIGERLTPAPLDTPCFCVIHPGVSLSTAAVFGALELTHFSPIISIMRALQGGRNDFEPIVRQLSPEIDAALDWLGQFGDARLTGTGACIFCPLTTLDEARSILRRVSSERPEWHAFAARACNTSPLHVALSNLSMT